jgi:two-component system, sensor histidine kinase and response regulator
LNIQEVDGLAQTDRRILVVDDDASLTELLEMVLIDAGYRVTLASNGRDAVVQAVADPPDLVVLDILMPEMDGWETSEHLLSHERTSKIPIIFLTAKVSTQDQLRGWYGGCFAYLTKPFDIQELLEKVVQALAPPSDELEQLKRDLRQQNIASLEQIVVETE